MGVTDRDGWIQDPDGNWHQKPRPRISPMGWVVIGLVLCALVAGGFYLNWKADQDRVSGEMGDLACTIALDC